MSTFKPFGFNVPSPHVTFTESWSTEAEPNIVYSLKYNVRERNVGFILGSKAFLNKGVQVDIKQSMTPDELPFFLIQSSDSRAVQTCYAMLIQEEEKVDSLYKEETKNAELKEKILALENEVAHLKKLSAQDKQEISQWKELSAWDKKELAESKYEVAQQHYKIYCLQDTIDCHRGSVGPRWGGPTKNIDTYYDDGDEKLKKTPL
jgi:hypothetical protein